MSLINRTGATTAGRAIRAGGTRRKHRYNNSRGNHRVKLSFGRPKQVCRAAGAGGLRAYFFFLRQIRHRVNLNAAAGIYILHRHTDTYIPRTGNSGRITRIHIRTFAGSVSCCVYISQKTLLQSSRPTRV